MRKIYLLLLATCFAALANAQVTADAKGSKSVMDPVSLTGAELSKVPSLSKTGNVTGNVQVTATDGILQGVYETLKEAFDAVNAGTHKGVITVNITGNTIEAAIENKASVVLQKSGTGAAFYESLTIIPVGGVSRVVKGAASPGFSMIDFSGADNVFIYGRNKNGDLLTILDTTIGVSQEFKADYTIDDQTHQLRTTERKIELPVFGAAGNGLPSDITPNVISATTYAFTSGAGTLENMSTGTTLLLTPDLDDAASTIAPIGFDFWLDGTRQLYFSANANGLMRLGSTAVSTAFSNDLASATNVPQVTAYWDDLWIGNNGKVHYKVVGTAPNRKLVVEWSNMQIPRVATATAGAGTFQVWLYETTGLIEFVYGTGIAANATNGGYSVGFGTSATQFVSITTAGPTAAYGTANNANTGAITSGTKYTFTPLVPADPGALSFTAVGLNTMTLNWADNATNELGYVIYRSFDGTNYEFIRQLAAGSTSSIEAGLASNTNYFWKVFAVTEGTFSNASAGSQATTTGTLTGTANIGPTGTYASIGAAVTAINTNGLAGNYTLELQPAYSSAGETFPLALNAVGSPSNTITLRPEAGATALSITSAAAQTLNLNGTAYWTIDGRPGGSGSSQLTVANTSTTGVPVQLINDARNNTLQYLTVAGVNTSTTGGNVVFSTTTGSIGNSNNNINNCDIRDGATTPTNALYSLGTAAAVNANNTITNNLVHDFFSGGSSNNGILLASAAGNLSNIRWTISNNRIYQSATRTFTASNTHNAILIGSGTTTGGFGYTITGNTIGFANSGGTGTYTLAGAFANRFIGIALSGGAEPSSIQGNTIAGFSLTSTSGAATTNGIWCGISVFQGNANIGTTTSNTIGSTSATGSVLTTTSTTGGLTVGINASGGTGIASLNISNNNIGGFTANGSTTSVSASAIGIQVSQGQPVITNNTVGSNTTALSMNSPTVSTNATAQTVIGINVLTGTAPAGVVGPITISNNIVANLNGAGTGTSHFVRGISNAGLGQAAITGNTIHDLSAASSNTTLAGGGTAVQGIIQTGTAVLGATVSQNTIYTIIAANTGAVQTNATGIGYSNPTAGTVTRNKIYDIRNLSTMAVATTPPTASGIMVRTGVTSFSVINNFISLGTSQTTNTEFIGIWNSFAGTSLIAHYNSVHIGGTAAAGALPSYGFLRGDNTAASAIITTMDIKNNIFNNTRTGGTGKHYAIGNVNSVPATGWAAGASNNNVLNNPVAANLGIWGLAADQTFAGWQTISSCDLASITAATVPFVDAANGDLHVNFGLTPTQLESGGLAVATTIDYDNQTRPGPAGSTNGGATAPDIGADEFDGVPLDITAPNITYTPLASTCVTGNRTLTATITDASGVPTSGIGLPVLYWRINLGAYAPVTATFISGSTYQFTFGAGAVNPDVVSYYIVAQDNVGNVGAFPGGGAGGFTANPPAAATPPTTPSSYTITSVMSGTYTVGAGGNFTTLTAAVAAYNTNCLGGPVVFSLTDASYTTPAETFPLQINVNADASSTNTLTIRPATGVAAIVTGSTSAIFRLSGADYITIDGINSGGSSLSLINTNTATGTTVVWVASLGAGAGATNNTIRNCTIQNGTVGSSTITNFGVFVGQASGAANGEDNDNNTISNNIIKTTTIGIQAIGGAIAGQQNDNMTISGNTIGDAVVASSIGRIGMNVGQSTGATISGNTILNVVTTLAGVSSTNNASGIIISTGATSSTVTRNQIRDVKYTSTSGYGGKGIDINTGSASSNLTISNNFVSNIMGDGWSDATTDGIAGIRILGTTGGVNLYNNSVNLGSGSFAGNTSGTQSGALVIGSTVTALDIRNNILTTNLVNTNAAGAKAYTIISNTTTNAVFTTINYNDYFAGGTQGVLGRLNSIDAATFAAWQTASGQDLNSQNGQPTFTTATDLHLVAPDANNFNFLESKGTTIASVPVDIDGDSRPNGAAYDIGADEFVGSLPAVDVSAQAVVGIPASACPNNSVPLSVSVKNETVTLLDFSVNPMTINVNITGASTQTLSVTVNSGTLAAGATQSYAVSPNADFSANGTHNIAAVITPLVGETNTANNTFNTTKFINGSAIVSLPDAVSFSGYTGSNLTTVFPNWSEATGATTPTGTTSAWTNQSSWVPSNTTAKINLFTNTRNEWIVGSKVVPTASSVITYDIAITDFNSVAADPSGMQGTDDQVVLKISTDCGTTWTNLQVYNAANTGAITNVLVNQSVSLASYAGQTVILAFFATDGPVDDAPDYDFHIDNIFIGTPPTCFPPTGLAVSNITATTADLSWVAPVSGTPSQYQWKVVLQGAGSGGAAVSSGTTTHPTVTATATGLTGQTSYDLWVRTDCGGGDFSTYAGPVNFTTLPANDNAPGAITLTVGSGCTGSPYSNSGATQSAGEPFAACKGSAGFRTVWFQFVAPASGAVRVSNDFSGGTMGSDSRMALFSATNVNDYTTFTNIACDDDNGATVSLRSILYATGLTPGNTYYVQVDGFSSGTTAGTFCLAVDELATSMITAATACTAGQTLFGVNDNYTGWLSATDNSGNLVALISNQTGGAGTSDINNSDNINAAPVRTDAVTGQRYLDRNFFLNSSTVTNANVRYFFLNTELTALQAVDPAVTLANMQVTRQTGTTCVADFTAASGTNTSLPQTANGGGTGYSWIQASTPGFSNFYLHTSKSFVPVKTWLQGAYNVGLTRHKDVTAAWAAVLNANALNQPYNTPAFGNYAGTESVTAGFFVSTAGTTDVLDWVLLEVRDATTPSTLITRRAAFIREDGRIVDLDGTSDVSFRNLPNANYFYVVRHRNHLGIRTAATQAANGTMGIALPAVYDFSTAQSQAFQDGAITANAAMRDLSGGTVFGMWGGNANSNTTVRASGPLAQNDYLFLITTTLGGDVTLIIPNVYSNADMNMDGTVRASGPLAQNDYLFLATSTLLGDVTKILTQHQ